MYRDRIDAGEQLAHALGEMPDGTLILGIPRGGVVVASALADEVSAELDVIVARKMRAPMQPELAVGAVGPDGTAVLDQRVVAMIGGLSDDFVVQETQRRAAEVADRSRLYRGDRPPLHVTGRTCVVVDDGIATGSTARAALQWLRSAGAREVVLAAPVAPRRSLDELGAIADRVVCPLVPESFLAVGQFYARFGQVSDDEVVAILTARHPA